MKKQRRTIKNPDGRTYRLPCIHQEDNLRIEMSMGYPTIFGTLVDLIGRLEDIRPLEEWIALTKK